MEDKTLKIELNPGEAAIILHECGAYVRMPDSSKGSTLALQVMAHALCLDGKLPGHELINKMVFDGFAQMAAQESAARRGFTLNPLPISPKS